MCYDYYNKRVMITVTFRKMNVNLIYGERSLEKDDSQRNVNFLKEDALELWVKNEDWETCRTFPAILVLCEPEGNNS